MSWMRVEVTSIPPVERWACDTCSRNGLTLHERGTEVQAGSVPCPERGCAGREHRWRAGDSEPEALRARREVRHGS